MNRAFWRKLYMGFLTLSGIARQGFFIPYRYANGCAQTGHGAFCGVVQRLQSAEPSLRHYLSRMDAHARDLQVIGGLPPPAPRWTQDWFPGLDAAMAYVMVREHDPARIVEIGSGHSTRFFARAIADGALGTKITAIDPAPRADLAGLGIDLMRCTVQQVASDVFSHLQAGDILSIDSSHILMPGSDVDVLLNRVMPMLPAGVLVHIHDMFLPDDYPLDWAWRGYNEQLGVAAMLEGDGYTPIWSSQYVRTRMVKQLAQGVAAQLHRPEGAYESSLWLRKGR